MITVLFADLKGSMELLADRAPEDARAVLDAVLEHMMAAVHHCGCQHPLRSDPQLDPARRVPGLSRVAVCVALTDYRPGPERLRLPSGVAQPPGRLS